MLIKSIRLENFQCYAGTENFFEFTEGLNVIIGDNATGKSKLYDAFNWVLFDKCFETESRKFKSTIVLKGKLISDQAKFQTPVGDAVKTVVTLTFSNLTLKKEREEITVKRTYLITKKSETEWNEPDKSEVEIFECQLPERPRLVLEKPANFIGRRLLPDNIRKYMWFQGEQVDELIDFENKEAVTQAVNALSNISHYHYFADFASKAAAEAVKEYDARGKRVANKEGKFIDAQNRKEEVQKRIEKLRVEASEASNNLAYAEIKLAQLISQVGEATEVSKLQERARNIEKQIKEKEDELNRKRNQINKSMFSKRWVLRNVGGIMSEYATKFVHYEKANAEKKAEQSNALTWKNNLETAFKERLPKGNPAPIYLEQMLEEERCLVCDREAKHESDAWLKIKELWERTQPQYPTEEGINKHDFTTQFRELYDNNTRLQDDVYRVDESIQSEMSKLNGYFETLKQLNEDKQKTDEMLESLVSGSTVTLSNSSNIKREFDEFKSKQKTYSELKIQKTFDAEKAEKALADIEEEIQQLLAGKMPKALEIKKTLLSDFKLIAESTRDRVFHKIIEQLEEEANEHFLAMTKGNEGVKGRIKLIRKKDNNGDYYMPKNIGINGEELSNINDSDIILVKVSMILAIISAKENSNATSLYTLISDAPSSKFTDNYTIGFCKRVGEVYNQSIIMSKDFYLNEALKKRLLNPLEVNNLGSVYEITPSVSEEKRDDRNALSTKIKKIR
jgi:DNA sulfur modification protein DndD